jgi:hypothetical protein
MTQHQTLIHPFTYYSLTVSDKLMMKKKFQRLQDRDPKKWLVILRCLFHQHFTLSIYMCRSQKPKKTVKSSASFVLLGSLNVKADHKTLVKSTPVSISSTIYARLFRTSILCTAFFYPQFGLVIFWQNNIGAKAARNMLMKLTKAAVPNLFFTRVPLGRKKRTVSVFLINNL